MGINQRSDGRKSNEVREISFQLDIAVHALSSVLISYGKTEVLCAVSSEKIVPKWMKEQGIAGGWLSAEYSMLPYSTFPRKKRDIGRIDGRSQEIQRLIGRSLRSSINLMALGSRTLSVDCDVLNADGGTRTAAITGASLALSIACQRLVKNGEIALNPQKNSIVAVSIGIIDGEILLDLDYQEDRNAMVDLNLVMNDQKEFVELQVSAEKSIFTADQLDKMLILGRQGIEFLLQRQSQSIVPLMNHHQS